MSEETVLDDTYSPEEMNVILQKFKDDFSFKYSIHDVVLILLASDPDIPVIGKTRYQKEIFVLINEILKSQAQKIEFKKYNYGPYSEELKQVVSDLSFSNLVEIIGKKNSINLGIKITEKGIKHIQPKLNDLGHDTIKKIKARRNGIENISTDGIMGYVYRNYREYLENAFKRKRYERTLDKTEDNDD